MLTSLLVVGVICAGAGVSLTANPFGPASFGWTAYSPLSDTAYQPIDLTWFTWAPRVGLALLAVGAGSAGAALSALVLLHRARARTNSAG